jgi:hypothetical protein
MPFVHPVGSDAHDRDLTMSFGVRDEHGAFLTLAGKTMMGFTHGELSLFTVRYPSHEKAEQIVRQLAQNDFPIVATIVETPALSSDEQQALARQFQAPRRRSRRSRR